MLLDAATAIIDEEFKRSERLDAKSRNMITVAGAFFAVVQAVVAALINETLTATATQETSPFVLWLCVAAGISTLGLLIALTWSYEAWRLRDDEALQVKTIRDYRDAAYSGNPAVGAKLVDAYAQIAEDRRKVNAERADAVDAAAIACGIAMALIGIELVLAFVAVAAR
jgi:cellobiose-specific phosphotransferase system component IIC